MSMTSFGVEVNLKASQVTKDINALLIVYFNVCDVIILYVWSFNFNERMGYSLIFKVGCFYGRLFLAVVIEAALSFMVGCFLLVRYSIFVV